MELNWVVIMAAIVGAVFYYLAKRYLYGPDLSHLDDEEIVERFPSYQEDENNHAQLVSWILARVEHSKGLSLKQRLAKMREFGEALSDGYELDADFIEVDCNGVPGEWVIAPGVDRSRRALYLHGGGFSIGSPKGHRNITNRFSKATNSAVLAINYRKIPENTRLDAVADSHHAYQWLLQNGPDGPGFKDGIVVGGDSAGANLALGLANWSSREAEIPAPRMVVAIAPPTDGTLAAPTFRSNLESDVVLRGLLRPFLKLPRFLLLTYVWLANRALPIDRRLSPLHDNLSNLPPTLIHASTIETLYGDAVRFANKAKAQGSPVKIQAWEGQLHDWHLFHPKLRSANHAWEEIDNFIAQYDTD